MYGILFMVYGSKHFNMDMVSFLRQVYTNLHTTYIKMWRKIKGLPDSGCLMSLSNFPYIFSEVLKTNIFISGNDFANITCIHYVFFSQSKSELHLSYFERETAKLHLKEWILFTMEKELKMYEQKSKMLCKNRIGKYMFTL